MEDILQKARKTIREIDEQIAALFEQRMDAVKDVAQYKKEHNLPILDPKREAFLLEQMSTIIQKEAYVKPYLELQTAMMDISKQMQTEWIGRKQIGYQGVEGAFSYIAAKALFPYDKWKQFASFEEIFIAVEDGRLDYGVIPFENSYTGDVADVMDLLRRHSCRIEAIYPLKVDQNLLVQKGTKLEEITHVYSHPQALSQCALFLKQRPWHIESFANTAMAASYVASLSDHSGAAIASKETARLYGLEILQEHINTSQNNMTRFIVISKHPLKEDADRFNVIFTVKHEAGQLAAIIDCIRDAGYNMECIKSYPQKNIPWAYYFYIEIVGSIADLKTKQLIANMKQVCLEFTIIGSYTIETGGTL